MANYVSGGQKRVKIFKKREKELIHAIKNKLPKEKQAKAVELLREAKLQAINVQNFISKKTSLDEALKKKELLWHKWESYSINEIIEIYAK